VVVVVVVVVSHTNGKVNNIFSPPPSPFSIDKWWQANDAIIQLTFPRDETKDAFIDVEDPVPHHHSSSGSGGGGSSSRERSSR